MEKVYNTGAVNMRGLIIGVGLLVVFGLVWENRPGAAVAAPSGGTRAAAVVPTLEDTLRKSETRAVVFLKREYGLKGEDIDIVAQQWYPELRAEVVKWRVRSGMSHVYVVTNTTFTGKKDINDYDVYNAWDVKVVNKFSE